MMSLVKKAVLAGMVVSALVVAPLACGDEPSLIEPRSPVDADRWGDVTVIGLRDAAKDSAAWLDGAALDRGPPPRPGGWAEVAGLSSTCHFYISTTPELAAPALNWKACPSGLPCMLAIPNDPFPWNSLLRDVRPTIVAPPYEDSSGVYFSYTDVVVAAAAGPGWRYAVVQAMDGAAKVVLAGAFGADEVTRAGGCMAQYIQGSAEGYVTVVSELRHEGYGIPANSWLIRSPWGVSAPQVLEVWNRLGAYPLVQGVGGSPSMALLERTAGGSVFTTAIRGTNITEPGMPIRPSELPRPAIGGYFALMAGATPTISFVDESGDVRVVVRPMPGKRIAYYMLDENPPGLPARPKDLVWLEGDLDDSATTGILYASPYATRETELVRRAVARVRLRAGVANRGVFACPSDDGTMRVVRLADGLGWSIPSEPSVALTFASWVNDDSVWSYVSDIKAGEPGYPRRAGFVRLQRPMGPPNVPSGL
ncbi:MAG: hypothetical protein U0183_23600 [Polyangiaceae bacterium]|jgi:hypothetical protein